MPGVAEKIFGEQKKISLIFGVKTKKRSSSQLTPRGYDPFASFRGTTLARGRGGTLMARRGATGSYASYFGSCPQIQGAYQKKGLRREMLGFVLAFTCLF